jgi:RimJ/RimL family protein N-acetyltransferase
MAGLSLKNTPVEIRFLSARDASAYSNLRLEALETEPEAFGSSPAEHRMLSIDDIATRISDDPENKFVVGAFAHGRLLGTAGFLRDKGLKERHKGQIWGVYITRDARGKGISREMLCLLLDRAIKIDGMEQIKLAVSNTQLSAGRLYRSLGFESFGLERKALKIGDKYVDEEHMVLYIKGPPIKDLSLTHPPPTP